MEKMKRKNKMFKPNRYWIIFIPLAIFLVISLRFPIRIGGGNLLYTLIFYGALWLGSLRIAYRLYQHYHWQFRRLLLLMILCVCLAGSQVNDLVMTAGGGSSGGAFGGYMDDGSTPDYIGIFWFSPLFKNENIQCHTIREEYFGNELIAIRFHAEHTPWPVCGG